MTKTKWFKNKHYAELYYGDSEYVSKEIIEDYDKEIERLNNIINELEKWIKENDLGKYRTENVVNTDELLDKLQELKGDSSNE